MKSEIIIEEVKYEVVDSFIGVVVGTVKFSQNGKSKWLTLDEADGMPLFFLSKEDLFDKFAAEDENDDEFIEYVNSECLEKYKNIELAQDYDELFETLDKKERSINAKLIRFICAIVRNESEEVDKLIKDSIGKNLSDIEIPEVDY